MPLADLSELAQRALLVSVWISLPALGVAALVGLLTAIVQSATQVHDSALGHLPKFLAVSLVLVLMGPWMGQKLVAFLLYALGAPG
jgi:type III secretory pathway component EscS